MLDVRRPSIVKELLEFVKPFANKGDVEVIIPSSGAAHVFQDLSYGPKFRKSLNKHIDENWSYYKEKISFPYKRVVGVGVNHKTVEFGEHQRKEYLEFLRSDASAYLWADKEEFQAMANIYQMKIKTITIKDIFDQNPSVTWIHPSPEMEDCKVVPAGMLDGMVLLHYDNQHFNLIVSSRNQLAKHEVESKKKSDGDGEVMDMSIEDDTDIIDYKQKYEILFKEHENCLKVVEKQKLQLSKVKPVEKDSENQRIEVASNVCFMCKKCNDTFATQDLLNVHEKFSHAPQEKIKCELCEEIFDSENDVQRHVHQRCGDRNQFNCKNCSFQGNSGLDLKNHSIKCKYTPSSEVLKTDMTCRSCGTSFDNKPSLMEHRRRFHADRVKICKYFLNGMCKFDENICWYLHPSRQEKINKSSKSDCGNCGKDVTTKSDLNDHQVTQHATTDVDFPMYQNFQPPDIQQHPAIIKLLEMMELFSRKVTAIETTLKLQK